MRKSASLLIPLSVIFMYYGFWVGFTVFLLSRYPGLDAYFPVGGIGKLADIGGATFEPVYSSVNETILTRQAPLQLLVSSVGALIVTIPVSWTYFITNRARDIDQSFVQTIVIMPVVVTGIAMIVINSLALAFALAGVVAAVRFRFTLSRPSDAMYIFAVIAIGLGAGIGAVGIAAVISFTFVLFTLVIWKLEYGRRSSGAFLTMMARRNFDEEDYD